MIRSGTDTKLFLTFEELEKHGKRLLESQTFLQYQMRGVKRYFSGQRDIVLSRLGGGRETQTKKDSLSTEQRERFALANYEGHFYLRERIGGIHFASPTHVDEIAATWGEKYANSFPITGLDIWTNEGYDTCEPFKGILLVGERSERDFYVQSMLHEFGGLEL